MRLRVLPLVTALLFACAMGGPASARIAVVTPGDDGGNPQPYPGTLPEWAGGALPLTWSYVEELQPLVVLGASPYDRCDEPEAPSVNVTVAQALQQMTALDAEGAIAELDALVADLPCLDQPATTRELARIYYYRGAALAFIGDGGKASAAMRRALAIDPDLRPDENLPPEINDILDEERDHDAKALPLQLRFPRDVEVRIDGEPAGDELALDALGLLQWREPGGTWQTVLLDDRRDEVLVATPAGIAGRMGKELDPHLHHLAAALGEALSRPLRVQGTLLYSGGDGAILWDAAAATTEWVMLSADLGDDHHEGDGGRKPPRDHRFKPPRGPGGKAAKPPTDSVRFAFGGGVMYVHPFPYASASFDATVRIYRALCLAAGADLGFPVTGYRDPVVLPLFHGGLRLRPVSGRVQPWFGAVARLGMDDRPGAVWLMGGICGQLGLDIQLTDHFLIRVSGEGGFLYQQAQVHAKIGVVLGI